MLTLAQVMDAHTCLAESDRTWLANLVDEWDLLADLSFSDLILWVPDVDDNIFWAAAQLRPITGPTALEDDVVGEDIAYDPESLVIEAYLSREIAETSGNKLHAGIPVGIRAIPVVRDDRCIAVVEMHTNQMGVRAPGALEDAYLEAADILSRMVWRGQFPLTRVQPLPGISPHVGDGTIRVNARGIVVFASPNALSAYRRLGLTGDLFGEDFVTVTTSLISRSRMPVEEPLSHVLRGRGLPEVELENRLASVRFRIIPLLDGSESVGQLVMCRDTTDLRSRERQLVTKDATIREIHHRVKNNLQSVAALLRLQARRTSSPEAKEALDDAMKRVGAIAVVHDILSQAFASEVPFDDVADRLLAMVVDVAALPSQVNIRREGTFGPVPASVATSLALVLTELCQNAIEHGLGSHPGEVVVRPQQRDGYLDVYVTNDGNSLPAGFALETSKGLGLAIVQTLVADLHGDIRLEPAPHGPGVQALVRLPLH